MPENQAPQKEISEYAKFVKNNYGKVEGAPRERIKKLAEMWRENKQI